MADTGFGRALEHLRNVADGDGHTEGKLFERLIMSFLKTDRLYADRFIEVWLWNDYPGRNGRPDFGIDLVAKESDGSLCAIQCKFYADKRLAKSDIDSFLEAGSRSEFPAHDVGLFRQGIRQEGRRCTEWAQVPSSELRVPCQQWLW